MSTCDATAFAAQETKNSELLKRNIYSQVPEIEAQDFVRLNPPKSGEWLHQFPESGQSLEEYKAKDCQVFCDEPRSIGERFRIGGL